MMVCAYNKDRGTIIQTWSQATPEKMTIQDTRRERYEEAPIHTTRLEQLRKGMTETAGRTGEEWLGKVKEEDRQRKEEEERGKRKRTKSTAQTRESTGTV